MFKLLFKLYFDFLIANIKLYFEKSKFSDDFFKLFFDIIFDVYMYILKNVHIFASNYNLNKYAKSTRNL